MAELGGVYVGLGQSVRCRSLDEYNDVDEVDEMVATERELAEDAQWKKIQQNTFTRWANEHLKTVEKHIGNLETDLCDGLRLITLIEVLSGKRLPKHNKKPSFRSQKLENVSVALKFLQEDEGIRIVNIGEFRNKETDSRTQYTIYAHGNRQSERDLLCDFLRMRILLF